MGKRFLVHQKFLRSLNINSTEVQLKFTVDWAGDNKSL